MGLFLSGNATGYMVAVSVVSTALALGISSGTSTYEGEYLEQLNLMKEIELHMLNDSSKHAKSVARRKGLLVGATNLLTPIGLSMIVVVTMLAIMDITIAVYVSTALLIATLFITGCVFGKLNAMSPIKRGLRMLVIGTVAFCVVYLLGSIT